MTEKKDLAVIGGGPGGYLAALRGAQLGRSVVLFEEDRVGGTCINWGCIPTKFLLHQTKILKDVRNNPRLSGPTADIGLNWPEVMKGRRTVVDRLVAGLEFLLKKGKVEIVRARAVLKGDRTILIQSPDGEKTYQAEKIILAAGGRAADLPFLAADGKTAVTSREALEFEDIPESLIVVGAGAIGLEMGSIYRRAGAEVTVLEILPDIMPGADRESARRLERILKKQGLKIMTQMKIEQADVAGGKAVVKGVNMETGAAFEMEAEKILLAAGRKPNSDGLADAALGIETDRAGAVRVGPGLETGAPGVYAIGDLIGGKLLAHKAYHDALVAVDNAFGAARRPDYTALPMAVFTEPEFASVGMTSEEADEKGVKTQIGIFPLQASGRAMTMDGTDGMIKIVADGEDRVLGGHVIASAAGEMIPVLTLAVARGLKIHDLADLIYIHPTISECLGEAALKAKGEALHILNT
jgi:dihydrolipoamide dehydrogenase